MDDGSRPHVPARHNVLGVSISATSIPEVLRLVLDCPESGTTIAICTVHSVMTARRDQQVAAALESVDIATPDGVPLAWALKLTGVPGQPRVDGFHLFWAAVEAGLERGTRHFFYGGTDRTLTGLVAAVRSRFPTVAIAGTYAPPFAPVETARVRADAERVAAARPDVLWIGLGMPKQELWMYHARDLLPGVAQVGVGAVFDWVAGNVPKAPDWMQRTGLEWLYRLAKEPRRLWRRYVWNNPAYLGLLAVQVAKYHLWLRSA